MKNLLDVMHKALMIVALTLSLTQSAWALQDAIIAVVNDELITAKDLQDYVRQTYSSMATEGLSQNELQALKQELEINGLNKLIDDKIILDHANKIGLEVREKNIDDRLAEIKSRYLSEQVFLESLIRNGGTITEMRNKIRDQFKIKYIIEHEVKSKIYVNPQEVTKYYDRNKKEFQRKERVKLDSIFIPFKDDKSQAQRNAEEALQMLKDDKDFKEVASKYSQSPSLGFIEKGQLKSNVEQIIFNLKLNEISEAVEVDTGIFIFKLLEKQPAQAATLQEVKDYIYNKIYKQKFVSKYTQWLDGLKKKAYIEIKK